VTNAALPWPLEFYHLEVFLARTAIRTAPGQGHVFPAGSGWNSGLRVSFFLAEDKPANKAHIGLHERQFAPATDPAPVRAHCRPACSNTKYPPGKGFVRVRADTESHPERNFQEPVRIPGSARQSGEKSGQRVFGVRANL